MFSIVLPKSCILLLLILVVGCGGGGSGSSPTPSGGSPVAVEQPSGSIAGSPGEEVVIITDASSVLPGSKLRIPPNAIGVPYYATFRSTTVDPSQYPGYTEGLSVEVHIIAQSSGEPISIFNDFIEITIPQTSTDQRIPIVHYLDPKLGPDFVSLSNYDRSTGEATFVSEHASQWLIGFLNTTEGIDNYDVSTSFHPSLHAFQVINVKNRFNTRGSCQGMCAWAKWYWRQNRGEFYGQYMDDLTTLRTDGSPMVRQDIIGSRAHLSTNLSDPKKKAPDALSGDHSLNFVLIMRLLRLGGPKPVHLNLHDPSQPKRNHAVLAYKAERIGDRVAIRIYDPNHPWRDGPSDSNSGLKTIWYNLTDNRFEQYSIWSHVMPFGEAIFAYRERFENILADADRYFSGSERPIVVVTSHVKNSDATDSQINMRGFITSGNAQVLELEVIHKESGDSVPVNYNIEGQTFEVDWTLPAGSNTFEFIPYTKDHSGTRTRMFPDATIRSTTVNGYGYEHIAQMGEFTLTYGDPVLVPNNIDGIIPIGLGEELVITSWTPHALPSAVEAVLWKGAPGTGDFRVDDLYGHFVVSPGIWEEDGTYVKHVVDVEVNEPATYTLQLRTKVLRNGLPKYVYSGIYLIRVGSGRPEDSDITIKAEGLPPLDLDAPSPRVTKSILRNIINNYYFSCTADNTERLFSWILPDGTEVLENSIQYRPPGAGRFVLKSREYFGGTRGNTWMEREYYFNASPADQALLDPYINGFSVRISSQYRPGFASLLLIPRTTELLGNDTYRGSYEIWQTWHHDRSGHWHYRDFDLPNQFYEYTFTRINSGREGRVVHWNRSNGTKSRDRWFIREQEHGASLDYHSNGTPSRYVLWSYGKRTGNAYGFFPDGTISGTWSYDDQGELHGPATDYYPSGYVQRTSLWSHGTAVGSPGFIEYADGQQSQPQRPSLHADDLLVDVPATREVGENSTSN